MKLNGDEELKANSLERVKGLLAFIFSTEQGGVISPLNSL